MPAESRAVETAVEAYHASVGGYPTAMSQLTTGASKFLRSTPTLYGIATGTTAAWCGPHSGTAQG